MCFIDGLKDHIHAPVSLHRPKNLDTMFVFLPYCRRRSLARKEGFQEMGFYAYGETICQVGFATAPAAQPY